VGEGLREMNLVLWLLGSLAILLGLGFQWLFWAGNDLPELSRFRRRTTFIRRTAANMLIIAVGLVLFAIPAAQDLRWQMVALSAIVALLMVVLVLAMWDWVAINMAIRSSRDTLFHEQLRSELLEIQAAQQQRLKVNPSEELPS
jgi:amino acid transporter